MFRLLCFILIAFPALAQEPLTTYELDQEVSKTSIHATQMGSEIEAHFTEAAAEVMFSPDELEASSIKVSIPIASLAAEYEEVPKTLKQEDWLNPRDFPFASFTSHSIAGRGDFYIATGILSIRGIEKEIEIPFTLTGTSKKRTAKGSFTISRLDFGVGQNEWQMTDIVAAEVKVAFEWVLHAIS